MHVVMLVYPKVTQLDLTGPYEVLARFPDVTIDLAWKTLDPVEDGHGLRLVPTVAFAGCRQGDILFVPGGPGQLMLMQDDETLAFLQRQAGGARWVTSVCTGSLLLAAAGLLAGYRATGHWQSIDQLTLFGCKPVTDRVVVDRDRVTGAGVTSGVDFALTLGAALFGADEARKVQLTVEYDPRPPFESGSPVSAEPRTVEAVRASTAAFQTRRAEGSRLAAERLHAR